MISKVSYFNIFRMSWSSWAKSIAKEAQRGIDKVLEINEGEEGYIPPENENEKTIEIGTSNNLTNGDHANPTSGPLPEENNHGDAGEKTGHKPTDKKGQKKSRITNPENHTDWDKDWGEESEPKTTTSSPSSPQKKTKKLPKTRLKATKIVENDRKPPDPASSPIQQVAEDDASPSPVTKSLPPMANGNATTKTEEEVTPSLEKISPEKETSSHEKDASVIKPDASPSSPEPPKISASPDQTALLDHVTSHADSLGNSFQILTSQLFNREQQIIKLSTNSADLQAENDELKSQNIYLNEQIISHKEFNKKFEVRQKK